MQNVGILYGHLLVYVHFALFNGHSVYFVVVWYIFHALACCTKKNLATLLRRGGTNWLPEKKEFQLKSEHAGLPDFSRYNIPKREKITK
jgi:hypothetical protein